MKKLIGWILAVVLFAGLMPMASAPQAQAAQTKPVWTIAWVHVPETTWNGTTYYSNDLIKQNFFENADYLKSFVEDATGGAVEIRITKIDSIYPVDTSDNASRYGFAIHSRRQYPEAYEAYDLSSYDSVMFCSNGPSEIAGMAAFGTASVYAHFYNVTTVSEYYKFASVHEFAHNLEAFYGAFYGEIYALPAGYRDISSTESEYWYDPDLPVPEKYAMPYRAPLYTLWDGRLRSADYPIHAWRWYMAFDNVSGTDTEREHTFFRRFFSGTLKDPNYNLNPGHPFEYLGVSIEMWGITPTNPRPDNDNTPGNNNTPDIVSGSIRGTVSLADDDSPHINLTTETITLPAGFTVTAYSVNGGAKWKNGALPTGTKLQKLFDKGLKLHLVDGNTNQSIMFPKIEPRPKKNAEKLKPFYASETWSLKTKTGGDATNTYEWANTTDKKTPSGDWQIAGDFEIKSGKAKTTYLFRSPATANGNTYTPASKIFKITPKNFGKAPAYKTKTDSKTGKVTVKLKANDWYLPPDAADPVKAGGAAELDVSDMTGTLTVWKGETGKKPRSEKITFELTPTF